jgi:hypothetical protein
LNANVYFCRFKKNKIKSHPVYDQTQTQGVLVLSFPYFTDSSFFFGLKVLLLGGFLEMDFERKFRNLFFKNAAQKLVEDFNACLPTASVSIRHNCRGCHRRAHSLCFDSSQLSWVPSSRTLALL